MARELMIRKAGLLIVALTLAGVMSLGGVSSLPAQLDVPATEAETIEDSLTEQTDADLVIDVLDEPPRYSDETTLLPASVVQSGQTVQWQWEGGLFHSVTSDPDLSVGDEHFDSGVHQEDGNGDPYTFEMTFTEPGVYKVFCMVHASQHGALVVV